MRWAVAMRYLGRFLVLFVKEPKLPPGCPSKCVATTFYSPRQTGGESPMNFEIILERLNKKGPAISCKSFLLISCWILPVGCGLISFCGCGSFLELLPKVRLHLKTLRLLLSSFSEQELSVMLHHCRKPAYW